MLFIPEIFTFCSSMYCSSSLRNIFSSFLRSRFAMFLSFLSWDLKKILHNLLSRDRGYSCKKIKNFGRTFLDFLNAEGARGSFPLQAGFHRFPVEEIWENRSLCSHTGSACYSYQEVGTRIVIMTFELLRLSGRKLIKSIFFAKKVGITFLKISKSYSAVIRLL